MNRTGWEGKELSDHLITQVLFALTTSLFSNAKIEGSNLLRVLINIVGTTLYAVS